MEDDPGRAFQPGWGRRAAATGLQIFTNCHASHACMHARPCTGPHAVACAFAPHTDHPIHAPLVLAVACSSHSCGNTDKCQAVPMPYQYYARLNQPCLMPRASQCHPNARALVPHTYRTKSTLAASSSSAHVNYIRQHMSKCCVVDRDPCDAIPIVMSCQPSPRTFIRAARSLLAHLQQQSGRQNKA